MSSKDGNLPPIWWCRRRLAIAVVAAAAIGACAFLYRFNALGGTLGGFDNDHFIYLIRTDMLLGGGQPLRDFVDAELRGAWPALSYAVSAWAQKVGGYTLLPEAYLTVGALAVANAIVFLLALDVSKRWSVALLAATVTIATTPKLYNYPKVLMLALGVWALRAALLAPSVWRLGAAALVTACATLFRHDLGVYLGAATVAALVARDAGRWSTAARSVGTYTGLTAACLLPSALWIQIYEGIPSYLRNALASVAVETARTELRLPQFNLAAPFAGDGLALMTYYAFWAVLFAAAATLIARIAASSGSRLTPNERATAIGLLAMAVLGNMFFLRANLAERFADAVVPVVLLGAWTVGAASAWTSMTVRRSVTLVPVVLLLYVFGAAYMFSDVARDLDTSGLSDSLEKTTRRYHAVHDELSRLPPVAWSDRDAVGTLRVARYVAECTSPSDHVLVVGPIHEILVFARRRFAAGQAMFKLSLYTSEGDQRRALERLKDQSVPVVVADAREFEEGFESDYPLLAQHLAEQYGEAKTIVIDDEPRFRVLVESNRHPRRMDPHLGLPCFR